MAKFAVTALGVAAIGVAVLLGVWLRDASSRPQPVADVENLQSRVAEVLRRTSASLAGGVVAGILIAGTGGRLLMRLIAATSDESAQGRLTEAEAVVGEVTVGGTLFLVVFVGLFSGVAGGLAMVLFRRFLPRRSWVAGLVVAGAIGGILARPVGLLDPDSIDFEILEPRWFAAALGIALIGGLGVVGAHLIDTFTRIWPTPSFRPGGVAGLLPLILLAGLGPAVLVALPIIALGGLFSQGRLAKDSSVPATVTAGVLILAGVVGWLWILTSAVQIAW